jgi:hypothetical protein
LTTWARKPNKVALEWIDAIKRGQQSAVREDINNNMIKRFKEYTK